MKKNEVQSFAAKWMLVENIVLSEINQAQKTNPICFPSQVGAKTNQQPQLDTQC